jgi:hypothetical protein
MRVIEGGHGVSAMPGSFAGWSPTCYYDIDKKDGRYSAIDYFNGPGYPSEDLKKVEGMNIIETTEEFDLRKPSACPKCGAKLKEGHRVSFECRSVLMGMSLKFEQSSECLLREKLAFAEKGLEEIYAFSRANPGLGFSCGGKARKILDEIRKGPSND